MRKAKLLMAVLAIAACVTACAPPPEKKVYDMVWPLPPEQPRMKFIESLQSRIDVKKEGSFAQKLFGEEEVQTLDRPYGVATDKEGRVYAADRNRVFVFDKKGGRLDFIGDQPGTGQIKRSIGVAVAGDGRVYVTDTSLKRVLIYDRNGNFISAIGQPGEFETPCGIAIDDKQGRLYVVDTGLHNFRAYNLEGAFLYVAGERGKDPGMFNYPTNVALDAAGNIYVVDTGNFRVQIFDPGGKFQKTIGQLGDTPGAFSRPKGIGIDSEGHIYVTDAAFNNLQIFDKDGQLLLFVGEGGGQPGRFLLPAGLCVDDEDRIYVADQFNSRIQVFEYLGEKWKKRQAAIAVPAEKK